MKSSQNDGAVKPFKTITKTIDLYTIEQLEVVNTSGYEAAIRAEVSRNLDSWYSWGEREAFEAAFETHEEDGLAVLEWDEGRSWLSLKGHMKTPSEINVARFLAGEEQFEYIPIGRRSGWTGWQYSIDDYDGEISDGEGQILLSHKELLEKAIARDVASAYWDAISDEYALSTATDREALYEICGTEYDDDLDD